MTIHYVDVSVASGGAGTEIDPYDDPLTAYTAASNGDTIKILTSSSSQWTPTVQIFDTKGIIYEPWDQETIEINASANTSSYVIRLEHADCSIRNVRGHSTTSGKYIFRITKNIAKFDDIIIEDCDGSTIIVAGTWTLINAYRVIIRRCAVSWWWSASGVAAVANAYACQSYDNGGYDRVAMANGTLNTFQCLSAASGNYEYWVTAGNLTINNPIIIHGPEVGNYETILNDGAGTVTINHGVATKAVYDALEPTVNGFSGSGSFVLNDMKGEVDRVKKLFKNPRRQASVCFQRDDCEEYVTGGIFAGEFASWLDALEARGLKGSYSISTRQGDNPNAISAAGWADLQTILDRGHDIGTEGTIGAPLSKTDQFEIQYTGPASVCRLVISDNALITYEDAVEDLNIPLPESGYRVVDLISDIDGDANYTATVETGGVGGTNARVLADIDIADIKASVYMVAVDEDRFFPWELGLCRQDIIDNLGGHLPVNHIYSTGSYNANAATYMADNGWIGGRIGTVDNPALDAYPMRFTKDNIDPFRSFGLHVSNFLDQSSIANLKLHVDAWCQWAMWHGASLCIFDHEYSTTSLAEWEAIFDAVIDSGVTIHGTLRAQYEWLQTVTPPTTADDDAWVAELNENGDNHNTGKYIGANFAGANGEPIANFGTDIGPVQSTTGPFHPVNL
jgi:hypothetical protein